MNSALTLSAVTKSYGSTQVLKELNLTVEEGEFICLLGPSGCGKTTLLRIIAGLMPPTSGEIRIAGRDVTRMGPAERNIAMVFQSYALYPHKTVRENIAFPLRMRAPATSRIPFIGRFLPAGRRLKEEIDLKVPKVARALGLDALLERRPFELSGGQKQRVALARALVRDPSLFLMDEPLSNLDAKLRTDTRREIVELHKKTGRTFIYVTHDQTEAMTMAGRIVLLNAGIVQQIGSPLSLYDDPENLFTASFIGTPTINKMPLVRTDREVNLFGRPLAGDGAELASSLPEGKYTLCFRPEALRPGSAEDPESIPCTPIFCEEMGADAIAWFRCGSGEKTGETGEAVDLGEETRESREFREACEVSVRLTRSESDALNSIRALRPDWDKALIFDESGRRVRSIRNVRNIGNVGIPTKSPASAEAAS